ncbi:MAG: putative baseplate assembly protein, partial [Cyanobacteria bacterium P01_H01_bin.150]
RYCPEWTNHNPSDPGITLIEMFAWLTDQMLLRFNQVPRRNYVAFLELLGIRLNPPSPASCELTFYLSAAQTQEVRIPRFTEVATVRTETEEAVIFTTDKELVIGNPQIQYLFGADTTAETIPNQDLRNLNPYNRRWQDLEETLLFDEPSMPGNCFYLVLSESENSIEGNAIAITFKGEAARTTGIDPNNPPLRWQAWDGQKWVNVLRKKNDDKTKGFSFEGVAQPLEGTDVILHLPLQLPIVDFDTEYRGHWIRCTYVYPQELQQPYSSSPSIFGLAVRSIGGAVKATQCIRVEQELLGVSNGKAGQKFELQSKPVLKREPSFGEHIRIKLPGERSENPLDWEQWQEVPDFAVSTPEDCHYTIDSQTGEVQFGPLVREPSQLRKQIYQRGQVQPVGRIVRGDNHRADNLATYIPPSVSNAGNVALERQYGKVPSPASEIYMMAYRTGGGTIGNVKVGKITVIKNSIPYVKSVINYKDADGGTDPESLDEAAIRVPELLRTRECGVTPEDFERIARTASGKVARAHCLTKPEHTTAGIVRLLIVPQMVNLDNFDFRRGMHPNNFALSREFKEEIESYTSNRKPLGVQIKLEQPEYTGVSVRAEIILEPQYNNLRDEEKIHKIQKIRDNVLMVIYRFLNPLVGGFEGKGWDLGGSVYSSDIVAVCQKIPGVRYLGKVELFRLSQFNSEWLREDFSEAEIDPGSLGLICSWHDQNSRHTIEFRE